MNKRGKSIKVRHYRRLDANSDTKELIVEIVTLNSETGRFLEKMEEKKMTRPCFLTIDMRGKVQGICKRYILNTRIFHLDNISYAIYQKGLTDNGGIYTLATYEAIVNGEHTHRIMNEKEKPSFIPVAPDNNFSQTRSRESGSAHMDVGGGVRQAGMLYSPPIIPFGYHRRRGEERLQYVTAIEMSTSDMTHAASTRNISISGILIGVKGFFDFEQGELVTISFTVLQDEDEAEAIDLGNLQYVISNVERKQKECLLGLRILDESRTEAFEEYMLDLIERYRRKYKLDVEDEFWSAAAWIYERVYTESMQPLTFFVSQDEGGHLRTQAVVLADGNRPLQGYFKKQGDLDDYSPLGLPHRLQYLQDHGEMLMVLYHAGMDKEMHLYSAASNEFDDTKDWYHFLHYALSQKNCLIVKMMVSSMPLKMPNIEKIEGIMEPMMVSCEKESKELLSRVGLLAFSAQLIDVTTQMKAVIADRGESGVTDEDMTGVQAWTGNTRCHVVDGKVMKTLSDAELDLFPELIHFGAIKPRTEHRYITEIGVDIKVDRETVSTVTQDLSVHGMCIKLPEKVNLKADSDIAVGLPKLEKMCPKASLSDIPYRLVKVVPGQENYLKLERIQGNSLTDELDEFFVDLIERNKNKLNIDYQDVIDAAGARVYESIVVDNLAGIPFFIARDKQGKAIVQWVAIANKPSALADYFRSEDGRYDLRWITEARVVVDLFGTIISMKGGSSTSGRRKMHNGVEMYFYKSQSDLSKEVKINAASELEFLEDEDRFEFIDKAIASGDYLFVKLVATYSLGLDEVELSKVLDPLRIYSRHKVSKLQGQLHSLLGCGEMFDITKELLLTRSNEEARGVE